MQLSFCDHLLCEHEQKNSVKLENSNSYWFLKVAVCRNFRWTLRLVQSSRNEEAAIRIEIYDYSFIAVPGVCVDENNDKVFSFK